MRLSLLIAVLLFSLVACSGNQAVSPEKEADTAQGWPKTPEGLLEHLNSWDKETLDKCERPEAYPNYKDTGETQGWISEHKEEFAKMGVEICWNAETMKYEIVDHLLRTGKTIEPATEYKLLYVESSSGPIKGVYVSCVVEDAETIKAVLKWVESVQKNCPPPPEREVELPYEPETQISFFKDPKVADKEAFFNQYYKLRDRHLYIYEGLLETHNRKIKITDALALYEILSLVFPSTEIDKRILEVKNHKLDWKNYDGTGDPLKAEYYIDGIKLGTGKKGIAELKRLITKMPKNSRVTIIPYYEGKLPYPFDKDEMEKYCKKYDVFLGIPKSK